MERRFNAPTAALACACAVAMACSDASTAPSSASLALHFDSLWVVAENAAIGGNEAQFLRSFAINDPETGVAYGSVPRTVTVTTASGSERWSGIEFVLNPHSTTPIVNANKLVLYRDRDLHTMLTVIYAPDGSVFQATLLANDTVAFVPTAVAGVSTATLSPARSCASPPQLLNIYVTSLIQTTCTTATFSSSASFTFHLRQDVDPLLASLSIPTTTFHGEQFDSGFGDSIPVHQAGSRTMR